MDPSSIATDEAKVQTYHRIAEAFKFAYARKTALGDGDFVDVESLVKNLTSRSYGEETRSLISDFRTYDLDHYGPVFYSPKEEGTSHSSILDSEGNAVSITSSLNGNFGSRLIGNRTGILFNDHMHDFSQPYLAEFYGMMSTEANFIQPGKRPLSAMSPSIVWDHERNKVSLVTGAAGGIKISQAIALNLMDLYLFNQSVPQSLDKARIYHELLPNNVLPEGSFPAAVKSGMEKKGHYFLEPMGITVVQMIQVLQDSIVAGCDYRKGGIPSGY